MMMATSASQKAAHSKIELPEDVKTIDGRIAKEPGSAELWFERGLKLGENLLMREAIESLSRAIALDPLCGIYYRWRGHRHLNLAEIPEACADFVVASRLIPDNWDVWYHLGLTHVLLGNYELAELAYGKCRAITSDRDTNRVALANWSWICLMHQGKRAEADRHLRQFPDDFTVDDYNANYLNMINFYKGLLTEDELLSVDPELSPEVRAERIADAVTHGFGVANFYYTNGDRANYRRVIDTVLELGKEGAWNCFGYAGAYYTKNARDM